MDGSKHGSFAGFEFTEAQFNDEFKYFRRCSTATLRCYMRLYDRCGLRGWGPNADELLAREAAAARKSGKRVRSSVTHQAGRNPSVDSREVLRTTRKKRRSDSPPGRANSTESVAVRVMRSAG